LLFFASVVLHELGHSVIALRNGIPVRSITLFIFGGVAQIGREPGSPGVEFRIAIAGPIVSFALAVFFTVVKPVVAGVEPLWGLAKYLAYMNMALVLFNLVPGYPLDGGRVFRAIVWAVTGNMRRATLFAAKVGRFFGFFFIFIGFLRVFAGDLGGLWLAFIGWFLDNAATAQVHQVVFQGLLAGHTVSQAMSQRCAVIPPDTMLQQVVDEHILSGGQRCLVVNRGENTVGLITLHRIKEVPRDEWPTTRAAQVMLPLEKMKRISPDKELWTALEQMDRDGVNQLPVMTDSRMVGILSREDVITFLRTLKELSSP
jgi:Zn-dependent protease